MKKLTIICFFVTFLFTNLLAQLDCNCIWKIRNGCDCDIYVAVGCYQNGIVDTCSSQYVNNGNWSPQTQDTLHFQPCTCDSVSLFIYNAYNSVQEYKIGDEFCCNLPKDCVPNNCVEIEIDKTNRRINLKKPSRCP
jgi:hypothetical protein